MKILHVITTLDVGGAEMHLLAQVRGQAGHGHEVHVAYLKGEGRLAEDFRRAGALSIECVGTSLGTPASVRRLARNVDLVHSHLLKADALCALALSLPGSRPLVSSKHNDEQVLRRPVVSWLHGVLGRVPRRTIVLSDHVQRFIAEHGRIPAAALTRIYYGLDPAPFEQAGRGDPADRDRLRLTFGFTPSDVVFICIARFAPQKAHDVLLRAFAVARRSDGGEKLKLLLVGDDPFGDGRQRAETLAGELDLVEGGDVVFAGIRRDVPDLLAASEVFVMSSLWEGLGLVFLEAMASSLPVLASDVSAVPEVVAPGETGLLVPARDEAALSAGLLRLGCDAGLRERFGLQGAVRLRERFGLERMVDETLRVYEEVLGTARSASGGPEPRG